MSVGAKLLNAGMKLPELSFRKEEACSRNRDSV